MRFKTMEFHLIFHATLCAALLKSNAQRSFRSCFVDDKPVSCNDPTYLQLEAGNSDAGKSCYVNNKPVSCADPTYLQLEAGNYDAGKTCYVSGEQIPCNHELFRDVPPGVTPTFGFRTTFDGGIECNMNNRPTSCDNSIFDKMLGRQPIRRPPATQRAPIARITRPSGTQTPYPVIRDPFSNENSRPTGNNIGNSGNSRGNSNNSGNSGSINGNGYPQRVQPTFRCGQRVNNVNGLITKAERVNLGEFPWHVAIYEKPKSYLLICSGSIISPYTILSAAHCFFDDVTTVMRDAADYVIVVGKVTQSYKITDSQITKSYEIDAIFTDAFYGSSTNFLNDIAILQTRTQIVFSYRVAPVCLYRQDYTLRAGSSLQVAGWGLDENDQPSQELRTATFPYVSMNDCLRTLNEDHKSVVTGDKFCVYHANGSALRSGDSGGGFTYRDNFTYFLVGIVSSRSTAEEARVSIITNVSSFRKWIRDVVGEIHVNKNYRSTNT